MARQDYFNLAIPAPKRLAMMRADFAGHSAKYPRCPEHAKPADWRAVRRYTHGSWQAAFVTLDQGRQGNTPIWYTHAGPEFRDERNADDIVSSLPRGYYTDVDACETAIGIVARLTHGRFIAGYRWTSNVERVYFPDVFTCEREAAFSADSHAESFADDAREDSERFNAMQDAETAVSDALENLADARALRRMGRRTTDDVSEAISALRQARETLAEATAAYERG